MAEMYLKLTLYIQNRIEELKSEDGQDLIEYALLAGLISIVAIAAVASAGSSVSTLFSTVAFHLSSVAGL